MKRAIEITKKDVTRPSPKGLVAIIAGVLIILVFAGTDVLQRGGVESGLRVFKEIASKLGKAK